MLVLLIVFAIVAICSFFIFGVAAKTSDEYTAASFKKARFIAPLICILIMVLALIIGGLHFIDSTEIGVVRTFGEITKTIDNGPNFVNPITDKVTKYDLRVHIQELSFDSYTRDAQPIEVIADLQYELDPTRIIEVARKYGTYEILESKLGKSAEENVKAVLARYSAMPLLENRASLSPEVQAYVETLEAQYPIHIVSVTIRDISFSDAFEQSVEAKMKAEQDALRAEEEARQAIIEAERDREVAMIEAEARVAAARGEADALAITRDALQSMPQNWISQLWIEKWNGQLPTYQMGENTGIMINPGINTGE